MNVRFRYSWIYDQGYRNSPRIIENLKKQNKKYPSIKQLRNYTAKIEELWKKEEKKILAKIEKITKMKWKESEVICYIIGFGRPFSDPLTLRYYPNKSDFIDVLTHELIHQIQIQNMRKYQHWYKYIEKKYKQETKTTRNHIALHAIHHLIYHELYSKSRFNRELKRSSRMVDYARSWQIVGEETPKAIIKKFHEVTK